MNENNKTNIDQIVASYASIGRLQKRRRIRYTIAAMAALPFITLLAFVVGDYELNRTDTPRAQNNSAPLATATPVSQSPDPTLDLEEFKKQLITEITALNAERNASESVTTEFENQSVQLGNELIDIAEQRESLDDQNAKIAEQRARIANAFAEIEAKQKEIESRKAELAREDPKLAEQRAQLDAERNKLESLRAQFSDESSLLEQEIRAINIERTELAAQRMVVQQRREELQKLIEKSRILDTDETGNSMDGAKNAANPENANEQQEELVDDQSSDSSVTQRPYTGASRISAQSAPESVVATPFDMPYLEAYELDNMRGGFDLGGGMEISIGLTRTASINGEEQYSNYMNLTDAMAGVPVSAANPPSATLVQNGNGNFVSPEVLDSMSGSFSTIIQNSLDNQQIELKNVFDISVQNAASVVFDSSARKAIDDSIQLAN